MPDTYGVTAADVAAEVPALFRAGFTASTTPPAALVAAWITRADTMIGLDVLRVTGLAPAAADKAADFAKQYVIDWVLGKVMRTVYAGKAPEAVNAAAAPYFAAAAEMRKAIEALGTQAVGDGTTPPPPRVRGYMPAPERETIVTDEDLDVTTRRRNW